MIAVDTNIIDNLRQGCNQTPFLQPSEMMGYNQCFCLFDDAAELIAAVLRAELPGFRVYFPAASDACSIPVEAALRKYYADVPRRDSRPIRALVDTSRITEETGWRPRSMRELVRPSKEKP